MKTLSSLLICFTASPALAAELTAQEKQASAFHVLTGRLTGKTRDEKRTAEKKALAEEALGREAKLRELVASLKKQLAAERDAKKRLTLAVQLEDTNADLLELSDESKAVLECQNALEFHYGDFTVDTAAQGDADAENDAQRKALELATFKKGDVVTLAFGEVEKGDCGQTKQVPQNKPIKVWVIPSKSGKLILLPPNGWEEVKSP